MEDAYERGRLTTAEFVARACAEMRLRCSPEQFERDYADIFWPNDPVCGLIPQLARVRRVLLLSNTNELHARQFVPQFAPTLRHFHGVVMSYEVGARKPEAAAFARVQELAECRPEECLFFDDLPANVTHALAHGRAESRVAVGVMVAAGAAITAGLVGVYLNREVHERIGYEVQAGPGELGVAVRGQF